MRRRRPDQATGLREAGIEVVAGDLTDAQSLQRACEGVEVVYNIAALYREVGLPADAYRKTNAEAVVTIIEAAGAAGARRIVHCSERTLWLSTEAVSATPPLLKSSASRRRVSVSSGLLLE